MVTIKMIAQKCGYSVATVSKAINGAPDISSETRELIRRTADEMGYMPNAAARMLKTSRSYNFGVLFEDAANQGLTHIFFSHILNGFKKRAGELGYDISFISDRLGGRAVSYLEHARCRNCDGVIIAAVDCTDPGVVELVSSGIPVVTIDYVFESCGSVVSDNIAGVSELVRYVHSMGHTRIAFAHGEDNVVTRQRITGFRRTCAELGIQVKEEYLVPCVFLNAPAAEAATEKLMRLEDPPTCILYADDLSYFGGLNALERMGLSVPRDVSAVGYDGADVSQMLRPRLTTLKQDPHRMGVLAAEELVRAVEEGRGYVPIRLVVPGTLIPGETVKKQN